MTKPSQTDEDAVQCGGEGDPWLKQAAEKLQKGAEIEDVMPQGLKPRFIKATCGPTKVGP
jgi:hypothetical protein